MLREGAAAGHSVFEKGRQERDQLTSGAEQYKPIVWSTVILLIRRLLVAVQKAPK
jgi:hypothetical protein